MGGPPSVCVVVLGEGGGGESLFILFLVSGVPELREGEASDRDTPRLSASLRHRLHSLRRSGDRGHRWASQRNDAHSEPARLSGEWGLWAARAFLFLASRRASRGRPGWATENALGSARRGGAR